MHLYLKANSVELVLYVKPSRMATLVASGNGAGISDLDIPIRDNAIEIMNHFAEELGWYW